MSTPGTHPVWIDSFEATEPISKFAAVVYHSDGKIKLPGAAQESKIVGIAREAALQSGDVIAVLRLGTEYVNAGASGNIGDPIALHDTQGRVSTPTALASGDGVVGHWEEAPTASGEQVVAYVNPRTVHI